MFTSVESRKTFILDYGLIYKNIIVIIFYNLIIIH